MLIHQFLLSKFKRVFTKLAVSALAVFCFVFAAFSQIAETGGSTVAQADLISWKRGGLRGVAVGPASERFPFQSEGSTIRLKDNSLIHVFNLREKPADQKEWHPHTSFTYIAKVTSRDDGRTWSAPEIWFRSSTGNTASHPSLARLPNGDLAISYNQIDTVKADTTNPLDWVNTVSRAFKVFRYSSDDGRTWSKDIIISPTDGYWTSAHDRMLVLSGGRIIQPLHTHISKQPIVVGTRIAFSDDNGRSWKIGKQSLLGDVINNDAAKEIDKKNRANESGFWEVSVAERADKSLFMIGRTHLGKLYFSTSSDQGETWTNPAPTNLTSPEAPARVIRVSNSDDLLLLWNSCCIDKTDILFGPRVTLSAAISSDGGKIWRAQREVVSADSSMVNGHNGASYPSVYFDKGNVIIGYMSGARIGERVLHQQYVAVLPIAWFYVEREKNETIRTVAGEKQ